MRGTQREVESREESPSGGAERWWKRAIVAVLLGVSTAVAVLPTVGCSADRSHSLVLMNEGVASYRDGNYAGATAKFKQAVEVWPDNGEAYYMLGQIYLWKYQQPDQAVTYLQKATEIDPEKAEYWYQYGHCQTLLKRPEQAEAALRKAVELKENHAGAWTRLGIVAEQRGELPKAAELYGKGVTSDPRLPEAYVYLGDLYYRNEKYAEAQQVFKNGVENNPNNAELHNGLGNTYLALDRKKEAVVEYQEALRLKSPYPSALYNLGMTYFALGDKGRAKTYLEKFSQAATGGDNSARVAAAQARLMEIKEEEDKSP